MHPVDYFLRKHDHLAPSMEWCADTAHHISCTLGLDLIDGGLNATVITLMATIAADRTRTRECLDRIQAFIDHQRAQLQAHERELAR